MFLYVRKEDVEAVMAIWEQEFWLNTMQTALVVTEKDYRNV